MTKTYSVQMPTNATTQHKYRALTLIEMMVAVGLISLIVIMVQINTAGIFRKNTFRTQANEFVSTMQMAATAAAQSDKRYEVVIDLIEQSYMLRQITSPDLQEVLEEEIIVQNDFSDNCQVSYILFDDWDRVDSDVGGTSVLKAHFIAGHAGWQYGGKIVLLDKDQLPYSVIVNRINRIVTLKKGDIEILMPKSQDDIPF